MSEIILSSFLPVLFHKLASLIVEEYVLWSTAKEELEKLENNLLDEFATEALRLKVDTENHMKRRLAGGGGLGKTTLSQLFYNDNWVKENFNLRIWVCGAEDFDVRKLTRAIIESASKNKCDLLDMDLLQIRLREVLSGERFLLVLDDVWCEDYDKWERLRILLRGGAKGSKVIVTIPSEEVASIMGSLPTFLLIIWEGYRKKIAGPCSRCVPLHLEEQKILQTLVAIGREIVKRCGGVPLAIDSGKLDAL
uniref:NB-ARC domain-containing protein n=1 Tax=Nelumbo nucifera TaxID=4432 RepID=A0A822ZE81_NELNU|nr:TPA_asm: hypothetical protein HUJ06_000271 [Nelumbo nucifera]